MAKLDWQHAIALGTLSYELGEAVWSLLPALARSSSGGVKRDRATGLKDFKWQLRQYNRETRNNSRVPLRRFGEVDEIAHLVAFMSSDAASFINGHTIVADGGQIIA